ncbi:DMT family transporter [Haloglycomyces albus]|uniref:DMT family transporter n=1 Tax=Haloglycomyces albus TaxID=526067 RepID=UPI00046D8C0F|nr:DMT family transporter [Haloglycomyces albus]
MALTDSLRQFTTPPRGALAFGAALASMTFVGIATPVLVVLDDYPVFTGQAIRFLVGGLLLVGLLNLRRSPATTAPIRLGDWGRIVLLALSGVAGFNVFLIMALRHADPSAVGTIIGGVPIALALLSPLLARRRPSPHLLAAAGIVTVGITLTQGLGGGTWYGLAWGAAALAAEVIYHLVAASVVERLGAIRVSGYACLTAVPMLLLAAIVTDGTAAFQTPDSSEWIALLYLSVFATALAFSLWLVAVPRIGVERTGLCAGAAPVAAVVATWVIGTGDPQIADTAGAVLVAVGIVVGMRTRQSRKRAESRQPAVNHDRPVNQADPTP